MGLGHAAGHHHGPGLTVALEIEIVLDGGHRLIPGRLNKAAGIDQDRVRLFRVGHQVKPPGEGLSDHGLGIDEIFRAPEGDDEEISFSAHNFMGYYRLPGKTQGGWSPGGIKI